MVWANDIELNPLKSTVELKTSKAITGAQFQTHCEILDSKIAVGFKKVANGDSQRGSLLSRRSCAERATLSQSNAGRMIYEYFKVSDADEPVLDLDKDLKNDNVQSINTRWDG